MICSVGFSVAGLLAMLQGHVLTKRELESLALTVWFPRVYFKPVCSLEACMFHLPFLLVFAWGRHSLGDYQISAWLFFRECHSLWCYMLLFRDLFMFLILCTCVCVFLSVCLCTRCMPSVSGGQKKALDALELELQASMSCLMWVLGTKLKSPAKAASAFKVEPSLQPSVRFTVTSCLCTALDPCL